MGPNLRAGPVVLYGIQEDKENSGYDGEVIAWASASTTTSTFQAVDAQVGGRFSSTDPMRRLLFRRDRDIQLLWIDPERPTPDG